MSYHTVAFWLIIPSQQVVVGAGAVEHDDLVKLADKEFASLSNRQSTTTAEELVAADPAIFTGSDVRIRDPDSQTIHLAVAFKGASWTDPDSVPLSVMQTLLGSYNKGQPGGKGTQSFPHLTALPFTSHPSRAPPNSFPICSAPFWIGLTGLQLHDYRILVHFMLC